MYCPGCDKWIPDYSDECWTCGYVFNDECDCSCDCDDEEEEDDVYIGTKCGYSYVHRYASGTKQCVCGKWVPGYSDECWTCGHMFYC